jgi:DNA polymerase-3 subunit epsilon
MILLSLDFETTGLEDTAEVTEVGAVLYTTGQKRVLEAAGFLVKTNLLVNQEVIKKTGIHPKMLEKFGYPADDALGTLVEMYNQADAIIGQNIIRFDKKVLDRWIAKYQSTNPNNQMVPLPIAEKLWIDTRTDLPGVEGKSLIYMLADHGIINPFPHMALSDCLAVLTLAERYPIDKIVERAKSPTIVLVAKQDRSDNNLAKQRKFRWNPDYKIWWKTIKEIDFAEETTGAPFPIAIAPSTVLIEKLWYD